MKDSLTFPTGDQTGVVKSAPLCHARVWLEIVNRMEHGK